MDYIFIGIARHFLQCSRKLRGKHVGVNILFLSDQDLRHAEFYIWNLVLGCLQELGHQKGCYLIFWNVRHHTSQGVETAHSVVVSFFVNIIVLNDHGDELIKDPLLFEITGQYGSFFDTHLPNTCSSIREVANENWLQLFDEGILVIDYG